MNKEMELDVIIVPEIEGDSKIYSISAVQVPNVVTQGNTIEEAKNRLREALGLYFEDLPEEKAIIIEAEKNAPLITRMCL